MHALASGRIVVGVDGSAASTAAVRWAVREARLRHATVHLVCAYYSDSRLRASYAWSSWQARQDERRAAARAWLTAAAELAGRQLPPGRVTAELADELPARALLDRAADAELLILGSTRPDRQPGQRPQVMGPVARACLRRAYWPVVVVALDDRPAGHGPAQRQGQMTSTPARHRWPQAQTPYLPRPRTASTRAVLRRVGLHR